MKEKSVWEKIKGWCGCCGSTEEESIPQKNVLHDSYKTFYGGSSDQPYLRNNYDEEEEETPVPRVGTRDQINTSNSIVRINQPTRQEQKASAPIELDSTSEDEAIKLMCFFNLMRDMAWGFSAAKLYRTDFTVDHSADAGDDFGLDSPVFGQVVAGGAALLFAFLAAKGRYAYKKWELPTSQCGVFMLASLAAIPGWDWAVNAGFHAAQNWGWSDFNANFFFGSFAAGLTEALIQWGIIRILPQLLYLCRNHCVTGTKLELVRGKQLAAEFFLLVPFSSRAGGIWNMVFTLCTTYPIISNGTGQALLTGLILCWTICFVNFTMAILTDKALQKLLLSADDDVEDSTVYDDTSGRDNAPSSPTKTEPHIVVGFLQSLPTSHSTQRLGAPHSPNKPLSPTRNNDLSPTFKRSSHSHGFKPGSPLLSSYPPTILMTSYSGSGQVEVERKEKDKDKRVIPFSGSRVIRINS